VLKNSDVTAAEIRSSSEMVVGDRVVAVGNPVGDGISSTSGIISIDSKDLRITGADKKTKIDLRLLRTDAAVNKGNFGGGLFDSEGRLVGIVNYKIEEYGVDNIGFAIPSTIAMALADNIIYHCIENPEATDSVPVRVLLGITVGTHEPKAVYDAKRGSVVIVEKLRIVEEVASTALAYGSIKKGDILLRASLNDGESVELTRQHYFIDMLLGAYVGDVVHITLLRDGVELSFDLEFTESCTTPF
jgi:serine protease Do